MNALPRRLEYRATDLPVGPRLEAVLALAYRARRPILLEGPTGIGKSEVVHLVAKKLGIGTAVLDLSLLEPPDLVGLPVISNGRTEYAVPKALPSTGAGILMLEELNRAERYIQQPALQLLTARRLHEYELPPDWVCFAAINPDAGDYQVTPLDRALKARFLHLVVRTDRAAWVGWAVKNELHPAIVALAQTHDRILDEVPPRTWTYASHLLRALLPEELADETLLRDALAGYLPPSWAELLLATRSSWGSQLSVNVYDLLASYVPGSKEAHALRQLCEQGRTDEIDEITHRLVRIVQGPEIAALAAEKRFSLTAFEAVLSDLPGDQRERLQEALGRNAIAASLIDVRPEELMANYRASPAEQKVTAWRTNPLRSHRLALLVALLRGHLEQQGRSPEIQRNNVVRINLGLVLAQLPERQARQLAETLLKIGITPVRPAG